jgi:hypothetical protein
VKYKLVINHDGTTEWVDSRLVPKKRQRPPDGDVHVSDFTFWTTPEELPHRLADDKLNGFHIEYKPDPITRNPDGSYDSYNAHIPKSELERYRVHHTAYDQNSKNGSGAMLSPEMLEAAERLARRSNTKVSL